MTGQLPWIDHAFIKSEFVKYSFSFKKTFYDEIYNDYKTDDEDGLITWNKTGLI